MAAGGRRRIAWGQARITRAAFILFAVTTGCSLLFLLSSDQVKAELGRWLIATPEVWSKLHLWKLVTSPLLEIDLVSLIFQGFALWMFLPALERWWGPKRFLLFALYTSVTGTAVGTLVGLALPGSNAVLAGLDPFVFGGIVAFGVLYANQPVQFFGVLPMTGRQLTIGMCGFVLLFVLLGQKWAEGASLASAMTLAWLMASGKWTPKLAILKWRQGRIRRRMSVLKGGKSGGGKGAGDEPKRWLN